MKKSIFRMAVPFLALPRAAKRSIVLTVDLSLCVICVSLAYYLRLGEFVALSGAAAIATATSVLIALPIFVVSGLYRAIFRYSGWPALIAVARAICIFGLLYASIFTAIGVDGVPRTIGIIHPILMLIFVGASRAMARVWLGDQYLQILKHASRSKVLIYGAGNTGHQLVGAMSNSYEMQVVGFLDDDRRLHGHLMHGKPIYDPADLKNLVPTLSINVVLLAMPNISRKRRNEILEQIQAVRVAVRTLPSITDLATGKASISNVQELDIDDLLGREQITPNHILLAKNVKSGTVMVTGAGGSIGSELCRQILAIGPGKLLLIEHSEFALYRIHEELQEKNVNQDVVLVPLLASVSDPERMREIISTWHPKTIYHAAAYKHVPLVEHNPSEGIKNNVLGTLRVAQAAAEHGVSNFVLVSTDKAVRPTNVMGASKRLAEIVLQAIAATGLATKFSIVRFGNVLGSSGSVVPKFRRQIRDGGPITLTHPGITRFFMTTQEAAQLVIQAGAMARGGDVFVLDMGAPVRIMDLARRMISLSGLTVKDAEELDGDIEIRITGLRPGEKLYEELLIGNNPLRTSHPRILRAHEEFIPWAELEKKLKALEIALGVNDADVISYMLRQLVEGYVPADKIMDWVKNAQENCAESNSVADLS